MSSLGFSKLLMDQYLAFTGSSALSKFRRKALAEKLGVEDVLAGHLHYVALKSLDHGLQADYNKDILQELLEYGDDAFEDASNGDTEYDTYFVLPRLGTISPWSDKATA